VQGWLRSRRSRQCLLTLDRVLFLLNWMLTSTGILKGLTPGSTLVRKQERNEQSSKGFAARALLQFCIAQVDDTKSAFAKHGVWRKGAAFGGR
jgi:hypothetical protein